MATVRAHLWFADNNAGEAAAFYAEHIPGSSVDSVVKAPENAPGAEAGTDFVVQFTVAGVPVTGLNAGPHVRLNEAFSFYLSVQGQEEVDHYWDLLTADGGEPGACGWCKDRFGVSWQVIPQELERLSGTYSTPAEIATMNAMLTMGKIDVAALQAAHDGA
ncbi:VOC family protein [Promicromonospora iranensis]|uniref:3-demethylubiquinone-9 3-methyltransferase (Glyoxalase superfamily) n=1 Tax=Promicromonospora iranensis TaxID=1105144 RepID=A0ABU2CM37_9MICO|nr:VOC family protein [Promicromonospora iranensis]MDR7382394.1 putative 3-demethylubiquinone-9 3-methyltransferase (glyoxalase superfamily) [Promicromonospora iranensis]